MTTPPGEESPYAVYGPALIDARLVEQTVHFEGAEIPVPPVLPPSTFARVEPPALPAPPAGGGSTRRAPLGTLFGARSGDKGGNANVGIWARNERAYAWLVDFLTADRLKSLLPECRDLPVDRYALPNILAVNFVVKGLLGDGVSSSTRSDPQAKSLGEYLRARVVDLPAALLD
jgi:hypothetical protein